jgi:hypothetical protein
VWGRRGKKVWEDEYNTFTLHVNWKMRPAETTPGMEEGESRKNGGGVNSGMICLIYCKNFLIVTVYPLPAQQ